MIFNALHDAAQRDELILIGGGMCHYHLRRDGVLTIREVFTAPAGMAETLRRALAQRE